MMSAIVFLPFSLSLSLSLSCHLCFLFLSLKPRVWVALLHSVLVSESSLPLVGGSSILYGMAFSSLRLSSSLSAGCRLLPAVAVSLVSRTCLRQSRPVRAAATTF